MAAPHGGWVAETFRRALALHIRSVVTVTCLLAKEALDRQIQTLGLAAMDTLRPEKASILSTSAAVAARPHSISGAGWERRVQLSVSIFRSPRLKWRGAARARPRICGSRALKQNRHKYWHEPRTRVAHLDVEYGWGQSQKRGARSQEPGARSQEPGAKVHVSSERS